MSTTSLRFRFSSGYGRRTGETHPGLDVEIALRFSDVVDDENSAGAFVVDLAEGLISLLSCGVPEGDFDVLAAHLYDFAEELYSDGGLLGLVELVADVPGGDVGLAGACRADDDNLEHLVVVVHVSASCYY